MKTKNNLKFEFSAGTILYYQGPKKRFYFLLQNHKGDWGFPKGNIEKGETTFETALRETKEETGIEKIRILEGFKKEITWFYFSKQKKKIFKKAYFYLAKAKQKKFKISFEHQKGGWFEYKKANALLTFDNYKNILEEAEDFLNSFTYRLYKNIFDIGTTPLRLQALDILSYGIFAALPENIIRKKIKKKEKVVYFSNLKVNLLAYKRIFLFGIGKAAFRASLEIKKIIPEISKTIILDPSIDKDIKKKHFEAYKVSHPFLSSKNIKVSERLMNTAEKLNKDDLVIFIISGGGSASFESLNIDLKTDVVLTKDLFRAGANIEELNIVRKHLSKIKGGGFAQKAYPARIVSLIFSDVIGNDLKTIASGPTSFDDSTKNQALKVLKKYNLDKKYNNLNFLETPKDKRIFKKVDNILILTNKDSLLAMKKRAKEIGWETKVLSDKIKGEAKDVGKLFLKRLSKNSCLLAGGETTVIVRGNGKGGRNQEVSLGALRYLKSNEILISLASDGHDNTKFAGAIADFRTKKEAEKKDLNIDKYLSNNNSLVFFKKTKSLINTGYTGTNIADLIIALKK